MARTLAHWEPFAELAEMRTRFDRMLAELGDGHERDWTPAIDVMRDDAKLVVRADVPGIEPDEITIQVEDDMLRLSGRHEERKEEEKQGYVRRERHVGTFMRTVPIPAGVDPEKITARTKDGVLEVEIPLPEEAAKEPVIITPTKG